MPQTPRDLRLSCAHERCHPHSVADGVGRSCGGGGALAPVYDELRRLAAAKLALEQPGQTLQATALVHEAYCGW